MELENRYFSIRGQEQWLRGHGVGIQYHNNGIQIEPFEDSFLEATYELISNGSEPHLKVRFMWLDRYERLRWIDSQGGCHRFDMEDGKDYEICTFAALKDKIMTQYAGWHDVFIAYDQEEQKLMFFSLRSGELLRVLENDQWPFLIKKMVMNEDGLLKIQTQDEHFYKIDVSRNEWMETTERVYSNEFEDPLNLRDQGMMTCKGKETVVAYNPTNGQIKIWRKKSNYSGKDMGGSLYYTRCFDSQEEGRKWQRLKLDMTLARGSQVEIKYYAFDDDEIVNGGRLTSVETFLENSKISLEEKEIVLAEKWSQTLINTKDTLINDAVGRYLIVRIRMIGTKEESPLIHGMRLYYELIDYQNMLPELYQADHDESSFLKRYLAIFETMLMEMEEEIDDVSKYFDLSSVKGPWLRWLADWLKLQFIESWSDEKLRKFIEMGPTYYGRRGTKCGIEQLLEFCLGEKPIIIEYDQVKNMSRKQKNIMNNVDQWSVLILLRSNALLTEDELRQMRKLINDEVPAYLKVRIIPLDSLVLLDHHTFLGINAKLSDHRRMLLDGQQMMIQNTLMENSYYELQRQWIMNLRFNLSEEAEDEQI